MMTLKFGTTVKVDKISIERDKYVRKHDKIRRTQRNNAFVKLPTFFACACARVHISVLSTNSAALPTTFTVLVCTLS